MPNDAKQQNELPVFLEMGLSSDLKKIAYLEKSNEYFIKCNDATNRPELIKKFKELESRCQYYLNFDDNKWYLYYLYALTIRFNIDEGKLEISDRYYKGNESTIPGVLTKCWIDCRDNQNIEAALKNIDEELNKVTASNLEAEYKKFAERIAESVAKFPGVRKFLSEQTVGYFKSPNMLSMVLLHDIRKQKEYKESFLALRGIIKPDGPESIKNHNIALFTGLDYLRGCPGLPRNVLKALQYFKKARDLGSLDAHYWLTVIYKNEPLYRDYLKASQVWDGMVQDKEFDNCGDIQEIFVKEIRESWNNDTRSYIQANALLNHSDPAIQSEGIAWLVALTKREVQDQATSYIQNLFLLAKLAAHKSFPESGMESLDIYCDRIVRATGVTPSQQDEAAELLRDKGPSDRLVKTLQTERQEKIARDQGAKEAKAKDALRKEWENKVDPLVKKTIDFVLMKVPFSHGFWMLNALIKDINKLETDDNFKKSLIDKIFFVGYVRYGAKPAVVQKQEALLNPLVFLLVEHEKWLLKKNIIITEEQYKAIFINMARSHFVMKSILFGEHAQQVQDLFVRLLWTLWDEPSMQKLALSNSPSGAHPVFGRYTSDHMKSLMPTLMDMWVVLLKFDASHALLDRYCRLLIAIQKRTFPIQSSLVFWKSKPQVDMSDSLIDFIKKYKLSGVKGLISEIHTQSENDEGAEGVPHESKSDYGQNAGQREFNETLAVAEGEVDDRRLAATPLYPLLNGIISRPAQGEAAPGEIEPGETIQLRR